MKPNSKQRTLPRSKSGKARFDFTIELKKAKTIRRPYKRINSMKQQSKLHNGMLLDKWIYRKEI